MLCNVALQKNNDDDSLISDETIKQIIMVIAESK